MKILLISPTTAEGERTPDGILIPQLALHILRGLTPPAHEVKLVDEESADIDLDEDCDLVGISCMTANAPRAYHLAREFRQRGRTVVLGGVHPTTMPEEALRHADAVVRGEAEGVWEQLLSDFEAGRLQRQYHVAKPSLDRFLPRQYDPSARKSPLNAIPIMSTRGCPYRCEFCCVSDLFGRELRHVPIENVVRDIEESDGKIYIFLDDNIVGRPSYARKLFEAIKPLKIKWAGQSSISFVRDAELMKLAADSGCGALFFGLESVSETVLKTMRKSISEIRNLEEAIRKVRDHGIYFHASLVFGFDGDTEATFPETLDFLNRNKIGSASINILTPYPGTEIHKRFAREGRLLTTDWRYYDHSTVVYRPAQMTPYELQSRTRWVIDEFTKLSSIARRLPANLNHPLLYLALNLGLRKSRKEAPARLARLNAELFEPGAVAGDEAAVAI